MGLWQWIGRSSVDANVAAVVAAIASAIAVIITALRKRRDVDIEDLKKRIINLVSRVEALENDLETTRADLVDAEHDRFILRRTLAANGIADPTMEATA